MKSQQSPARAAALRALEHLTSSENRVSAQFALSKVLSGVVLAPCDRALCTELVYGVLRWELRLNRLLDGFLASPAKTPYGLRLILLIAMYEWLYLDRVPNHAIVDSAVNAARHRFGLGLSKVTNGVLRTMMRQGANMADPWYMTKDVADLAERLSLAFSLPAWICTLWVKAYGEERATHFAKASVSTPWPCFRVNAAHSGAESLRAALIDQGDPDGVQGEAIGAFGVRTKPGCLSGVLNGLCESGRLSRQGAGSQSILAALDMTSWQGTVWDACAGFGNKTFALLEQGIAICAASDTHAGRLEGLKREAQRLGLACPPLFETCAATAPPAGIAPNHILLDVPCSGLGTLARHPDIRRHRVEEDIPPLMALQAQLLDRAWSLLPAGGRIAYITCTLNPAENEDQITAFLERTPHAVLEKSVYIDPDLLGADGMFGAVVSKIL